MKRAVFVLALLLALFPFMRPQRQIPVRAASLQAYPSYCLGGWENPSLASGRPDIPEGENAFARDNSAVLNGKTAQLFCGYFQSDDRTFPPEKVALRFSWRADFTSRSSGSDADAETWSAALGGTSPTEIIIPPPVSPEAASSTSAEIATTTIPFLEATTTPAVPPADVASSTAPGQPAEEIILPAASEPAPAPIPTAASTETPPAALPAATSSEATSTVLSVPRHQPLISRFVRTAFAESPAVSFGADFMEVRYSVDGAEWKSAGRVGESNWKNFSAELPLSSWEDIDKLQIELVPLPTQDFPTMYLDGLWLEMTYDHSFADVVSDSMSTVADAASEVGEAINSAVDAAATAVADAVTSVLEPAEAPVAQNEPPIEQPTPETPKAKPLPFRFDVGKEARRVAEGALPWIRNVDLSQKEPNGKSTVASEASVADTERSLRVEGVCRRAYYVVLLFAGPNDYLEDPSRALVNRAGPCVNGSFVFDLSEENIPATLADGTYYLVTGEEDATGPWELHGVMREIVIKREMPTL